MNTGYSVSVTQTFGLKKEAYGIEGRGVINYSPYVKLSSSLGGFDWALIIACLMAIGLVSSMDEKNIHHAATGAAAGFLATGIMRK